MKIGDLVMRRNESGENWLGLIIEEFGGELVLVMWAGRNEAHYCHVLLLEELRHYENG
jgi:hypothetical protein